MCGIAGAIGTTSEPRRVARALAQMEGDLRHRGPDDSGVFQSEDGLAGLVNTRLAILDLSHAGHQPMSSRDGRYRIVFNGEIYNFKALRGELEAKGEQFESHSDTEVVLRMFQRDGPEFVRELAGMFAVAIWDAAEQSCFLARDPLGVKPLYYTDRNGALIFASEVNALIRSGLVPLSLSPEAVSGYLLFGAVQEPLTLVEGVRALSPGHYLVWRRGQTTLRKYWDIRFSDGGIPAEESPPRVRQALEESVARHLVSDVPVGIFLSGGIDSTAMVALSSARQSTQLKTFCISFADQSINEGKVAARTARHFGTDHVDWELDSATAKSLLAKFLAVSDQPSIDGFNTFCVAKLAHEQGLKVVLSGLGGDELFGGYQSFQTVPKLVRASRALTPIWPLKMGAGRLLQALHVSPRTARLGHFLRDAPLTASAYWAMRGIFTPAEVSALLPYYGCEELGRPIQAGFHVPSQPTIEDEVSYVEIGRYIRNQLLRDSDVMSMAWSLELRVPFVDSRLVEAIESIPAAVRLARGKKLVLDAVPEIPEWVRNRPKQGFTFPFQEWVTGEWDDIFKKIGERSPVPLKSWYRSWCLFALDNFIARHSLGARLGPSGKNLLAMVRQHYCLSRDDGGSAISGRETHFERTASAPG